MKILGSPFFVGLLIMGCLMTASNGLSQVSVTPFGYGVYAEAGDAIQTGFVLHNSSENEVNYDIRLRGSRNNVQRMGGPRRDDPGDVIQTIELAHPGALGIGRDFENDIMWVSHTVQENGAIVASFITGYEWNGRELGDVVLDINPNRQLLGGTYYDRIIYATSWGSPVIIRYDVEGNMLDDINLNAGNPMGFCVDPERELLFVIIYSTVNIIVLDINDNFNQIATIESILGHGGDADYRSRLCWVPEHEDGHLWLGYEFRAYQIAVHEDWSHEVVQDFAVENDVRSFGIGHDGENLWTGNAYTNEINIIDDGIVEPNWLTVDPLVGAIAGGEDAEITATVVPEGFEEGVYDLIVIVDFDDENIAPIEMSIVLSYETPHNSIAGTVVQPNSDEPIPDVHIALGEYEIDRWTDGDGAFLIEDLPLGNYQITASAPDYLPTTANVELGENGLELTIELFHAEFNLSTNRIATELAPDAETHIAFSSTNDGNGPCSWSVEKVLPGGANAEPWEIRAGINFGQILEDDRIEGVAFTDGNFYIAGANGNDPNTIYVTDIDGQPVGSFVQPGESRYGMKDLEWDGELLWGSGEANIFGFDTEGNVEHEFAGPHNPNNCIAYDSHRDILWISGTTTDIVGYTKEGEPTGTRWNRRGLRIYGLAYYPDDPDGYTLYIVNSPDADLINIHKMNPENGDTLLARSLVPAEGATAGGTYISSEFDVYSWVLLNTNNIPPANGGDRVNIFQIDSRRDWFQIDPAAGVIEPGDEQEFDLHFNAAGLPAVEFAGELHFTHTGVGSAAVLPVRLSVVEGPVWSERIVPLNPGWNLISTNIQPEPDNIVDLTNALTEAGILEMVKDDQGHFYRPSIPFSNLSPWLVSEGYLFKVSQATELHLEGMSVLADDPIQLAEGWQSVAYYPRVAVNAMTALSGIEQVLIIAKDGAGNFYLPAHHFSNMGEMRDGRGYQIKVSEAVELVYQVNEDRNVREYSSVYDRRGRYSPHSPTGVNMSLLVKSDLADGTDIGVFAGNQLVGCGTVQSGMTGIAIWGDDPATETIDGAREREPLTIRLRNDLGEFEAAVTWQQGEPVYTTDNFAVVSVDAAAIPLTFGLSGVYPNPFNSTSSAMIDLPKSSLVNVGIYDLSGRHVLDIATGEMSAGSHKFVINGETLSSGIYILRVESSFGQVQKKIAMIR